jgi:hypothetical protein
MSASSLLPVSGQHVAPLSSSQEVSAAPQRPQNARLDLFQRRYEILSSCEKIYRRENLSQFLFDNIPDVGTDLYLVSTDGPLGTRGMGPAFAVCSIGKTASGDPVLGLCHRTLFPCTFVVQKLKDEMVKQGNALPDTITTYVVGGEEPSEESPEGTIAEEIEFVEISEAEKIEGVLFNETTPGDDSSSLSAVVTHEGVFVSHDDLFPVTAKEDGNLIGTNSDLQRNHSLRK